MATEDPRTVTACLDALATQTLPPSSYDVVLVHAGDSQVVTEAESVRRSRPELRLRLLDVGEAGRAEAAALGIAVASGDHVTVLDIADRFAADYLERMLAAAGPDVVVVAGTVKAPYRAFTGLLLPRDLAHLAGGGGGTPPAWWLALHTRRPFVLRVARDASYERRRRPGDGYDARVTPRLRTLAALEHVDCADVASRALRTELARDEATRLNRHLRAHPEGRDRVVADADALGLAHVPWSVVNEGLGRDLAIAFCFPPSLDTSGLVAAKRLRLRGRVTDVISHDLSTVRVIDERSTDLVGAALGRTHEMPGKVGFADWEAISAFAAEAEQTVQAWEEEQGPYRTLYSRAMAPASHFAAALVKSRRPDVHWTAEISDPLDVNPAGEHRPQLVHPDALSEELVDAVRAATGYDLGEGPEEQRLHAWCELVTYALADEIVFTNENQRTLMLDHHANDRGLAERARERSLISPHPDLPRSFYELEPGGIEADDPPGVVRLAYFGVFYATRDLGDLVAALQRLRLRERERLRLHVYTSKPRALALRLAREGLAGTVVPHPYRPFFEFLALTTQFDVLVVDDAVTAGHHAVNPYLPSKLADYRGSGTPIWAICEPGSVMSSMRFSYQSTLGDVDQAVAVLRSLLAEQAAE